MVELTVAGSNAPALVDDSWADFQHRRWRLNEKGYVIGSLPRVAGVQRKIRLHRLVMGAPPFDGAQVDHIDGDKLNNTLSNLRWVSQSENQQNRGANRNSRSGIKGVYWHTAVHRWVAVLKVDGRERRQYFDDLDAAIACRWSMTVMLHPSDMRSEHVAIAA